MKNILSFWAFLFLVNSPSYGQNGPAISGRVIDTSGNAIQGATIKAYSAGSRDTLKVVSGQNGFFRMEKLPWNSFSLTISNIGFENWVHPFTRQSGDLMIEAGVLQLRSAITTLEEVLITTPAIQVKEDTVEFKADSFKVKPNSVVEDLLKKLPGVSVDKNGDITAGGKSVTKIKVNGKDFFGGDPKAASRELPADIVDKVQVLDDYGDLSNVSGIKDGEPDKVINITLKKEKNKGVFGRATAGYGTNDRYQSSLNANFFDNNKQLSVFGNSNNANTSLFNFGGGNGGGNSGAGGNGGGGGTPGVRMFVTAGGVPGQTSMGGTDGITTTHSIGTNYRQDFDNKRGSIYGSYSFARNMTDGLKDIAQQNFYETETFLNNQHQTYYNTGNNHRANLNLEYNIDSFNYIKISPNFTLGKSDNQSHSDFSYFEDLTIPSSRGFNQDSTLSRSPNFSLNAIYNHRFRKTGRNLSLNLNTGGSDNVSSSGKLNMTDNLSLPFPVEFRTDQLIKQDNNNRNLGLRVNYSEPIAPYRYLDIVYAYNSSYAKNDRKTYAMDSLGVPQYVQSLSNAYENNYFNQRLGVNIRTVKKKYNYTLGVSFQPVELRGYSITKDSSYKPQKRLNIFPVARFAYNFSKTKTLNFNYNGFARQPSFSQLQPVRDISNPQYQTQGNPDLKPEIYHNMSIIYNNLNFISGRVLFMGTNLGIIHNQIVNNNIRLGNGGAQLSIPVNEDGYYNASGFYTYSKPFQNRRYVFTLNGSANFNHNITLIDSARNVGKNWIASQGAQFEFNHKDWLEWTAGARYGLNSTRYSLPGQQKVDYHAWVFTSSSRMDISGGIVFRYDFEYTLNQGLSAGLGQNIALLNASVEKTLFKQKNGFLRLSGYDILNQNKNITRTVTGNSITDMRVNRLTRYFMISFSYRLNRFAGKQSGSVGPGGQQMRFIN